MSLPNLLFINKKYRTRHIALKTARETQAGREFGHAHILYSVRC
jgi:hypothetical protein